MLDQLSAFIARHRRPLEEALAEYLPVTSLRAASRLNKALDYALFPGGKRLRPMLTLLGAQAAGGAPLESLRAACAIEYVHTSSIILDDLPAMDDADLRRGRAALHLAFGEDLATLAALALLNQAYALLARAASAGGAPDAAGRLVAEAASCIGANGMIGGQVSDLECDGSRDDLNALETRSLKTAALMRLTLSAGALACGASEEDSKALACFGESLGTAYQIQDDLLDRLGDVSLTGKTPGQDARHLRSTFVAELGIEGAHDFSVSLVERGKAAILDRFGETREALLLNSSADFIMGEAGRWRLVPERAGAAK
ncbi:MAG TPA: polyprenyl synthetase family protein [Blastocatellia bacterium]|nr:polyprenyl synthetase family protein [Blastocatellia bacterium]